MTIIIIMSFIKVSCLIAQAQCLTNWGDLIYLYITDVQVNVPMYVLQIGSVFYFPYFNTALKKTLCTSLSFSTQESV